MPIRREEAEKEKARNKALRKENPQAKANRHHQNFLNTWWKMSWPREDLTQKIRKMRRYCVCGRVAQRAIFEFVSSSISPNDALVVFAFEDDYSFGVLQSSMHWAWATHRCSTLGTGFRYTINTVYDSFPWPQAPKAAQIRAVAKRARELRQARTAVLKRDGLSYRDLYRAIELPGDHEMLLRHKALDEAVYAAYGRKKTQNKLDFLLKLNVSLSQREADGQKITGPGLPRGARAQDVISKDCISL